MWHPVGPLPARVYWRRRLVVLTVLLTVIGGSTWGTLSLLSARAADAEAATSTRAPRPAGTPALERVVPPLGSIATPTPPDPTGATPAEATSTAPAPIAGGPCTDDMIALEVRTPPAVAPAGKPTFELVVTNISAVPCLRALDKGRQEIALYDGAGTRIWGSNDCFPEASSDPRTLAPGEMVSLPVTWGGLTSEPTCTAARTTPGAGAYSLVGRLDTKVSPDTPLTLGP